MNKKWLVVYTKSRSEQKVASRLEELGFTFFYPVRKEIKIWSDRKKVIEAALFPSYVFVCVTELDRLKVLEILGVVNFLFWLGKPAVVRETEIEAIRIFLGNYSHAYSKAIPFSKGQKVVVKEGQLKDKNGIVEEIRNQTVVIRLEGLGFELLAEIQKGELEKPLADDKK
jgi:transcription antitermination factor NusG